METVRSHSCLTYTFEGNNRAYDTRYNMAVWCESSAYTVTTTTQELLRREAAVQVRRTSRDAICHSSAYTTAFSSSAPARFEGSMHCVLLGLRWDRVEQSLP